MTTTTVLNMIVKNEEKVIARCIESCFPMIDAVTIVDTGSTDDTVGAIRKVCAALGLRVHLTRQDWVNFEVNRNQALEFARLNSAPGDLILFMDADDTMAFEGAWALDMKDADCCMIKHVGGAIEYELPLIIRNDPTKPEWRWHDVQHAYFAHPGAVMGTAYGIRVQRGDDGARRRDPATYKRDIENIYAAWCLEEPGTMQKARYEFYLGQSHECAGSRDGAIGWYLTRAESGHWIEERFVALLRAARLMGSASEVPFNIVPVLQRAIDLNTGRAEAHHEMARVFRSIEMWEQAATYAELGLRLQQPASGLFLEPWVYKHGLWDELCITRNHTGNYHGSVEAGLSALRSPLLPAHDRDRIISNMTKSLYQMPTTPK